MEFTGVYHKTSEQMSYPLNEDELVVNLKTGYDVKRVFIHHGDPFEAGILGGKEKWTGKRGSAIRSGGPPLWFHLTRDVNITLNCTRTEKSGTTARTVS